MKIKFKLILKGEESAFVPGEVSKKIRVRCTSARRCSCLKKVKMEKKKQTDKQKDKHSLFLEVPFRK